MHKPSTFQSNPNDRALNKQVEENPFGLTDSQITIELGDLETTGETASYRPIDLKDRDGLVVFPMQTSIDEKSNPCLSTTKMLREVWHLKIAMYIFKF